MTAYSDGWITIDDDGISIRGYYIPWGTKHIRYENVVKLERVNLGLVTGRARIWGSANPFSVWASLDLRRPRKRAGFLVNSGHAVRALITPDDPDAAEAALREHLGQEIFKLGAGRAPIV